MLTKKNRFDILNEQLAKKRQISSYKKRVITDENDNARCTKTKHKKNCQKKTKKVLTKKYGFDILNEQLAKKCQISSY